MNEKLLISGLLLAVFNFLIGCYHFKSVTVPEYKEVEYKEGKPYEIFVKTKEEQWYHFTHSRFYVNNDTLYGYGSLLSEDWQKAKKYIHIEGAEIESLNE